MAGRRLKASVPPSSHTRFHRRTLSWLTPSIRAISALERPCSNNSAARTRRASANWGRVKAGTTGAEATDEDLKDTTPGSRQQAHHTHRTSEKISRVTLHNLSDTSMRGRILAQTVHRHGPVSVGLWRRCRAPPVVGDYQDLPRVRLRVHVQPALLVDRRPPPSRRLTFWSKPRSHGGQLDSRGSCP